VTLLAASAPFLLGQSEAELKRAFEGTRVTVKIEMPATQRGIDLHLGDAQPIDFRQYSTRIKQYGTALRPGDSVLVTTVKVNDDLIEFQLGGGGYGTVVDDTSESVYVPHVQKTSREKELEKQIDRETDPGKRKRLKNELSDLRSRRQRDNQVAQALGAQASQAKRAHIREKAVDSGSRFNLRYGKRELKREIPTPEQIKQALSQWVDF
jgi:hypothetical protein